jgi:hypothetical protein
MALLEMVKRTDLSATTAQSLLIQEKINLKRDQNYGRAMTKMTMRIRNLSSLSLMGSLLTREAVETLYYAIFKVTMQMTRL